MATPEWDLLRRTWADDEGALVDIRVPNATVDEWRRLIEELKARWPVELEADGEAVPLPLPPDLGSLFDPAKERFWLLRVALTPLINLNAHLPDEEIEFDFDPNEVLDQADLDAISEFVLVVGRTVRRTVHVLVESGELGTMDSMRYDHVADRIVVVS
jgi:hypothetical protein